jgi:hypothetical protein
MLPKLSDGELASRVVSCPTTCIMLLLTVVRAAMKTKKTGKGRMNFIVMWGTRGRLSKRERRYLKKQVVLIIEIVRKETKVNFEFSATGVQAEMGVAIDTRANIELILPATPRPLAGGSFA